LEKFPMEMLVQEWPALGATPAAPLVRLLLLATCFGRTRFASCFHDPFWRDLLGVPASVTAGQIQGWFTRLGRPRRQRIHTWLQAACFAVQASEPEYFGTAANAWHGALIAAAHGVLRTFARGILGFGESRCEFLYANFLAIGADLEIEESRRIVLLERATLNLMLNIGGLNRGTRHLEWIRGGPLTLFSHG
jgi:hypothetical protein